MSSRIAELCKRVDIEPTICKYAKYGYEGEEGLWYFCNKHQKECYTYPTGNANCVAKGFQEPSDTTILKLICAYNLFQNNTDKLFTIANYSLRYDIIEIILDELKDTYSNHYYCNDTDKLLSNVKDILIEEYKC